MKTTLAAQTKKKEESGIFSDDDDFLGGLGIEEKGPSAPKAKLTEEEDDKPARSVMDKLLAKDSAVSKHLETKKERREFVLDKKYTQPNNGNHSYSQKIKVVLYHYCKIFQFLLK